MKSIILFPCQFDIKKMMSNISNSYNMCREFQITVIKVDITSFGRAETDIN
jgi:hypothetical protein